jgi:hypothetical protein
LENCCDRGQQYIESKVTILKSTTEVSYFYTKIPFFSQNF